MDNNSTNDTDKRNWRERLGVGSKVMPRISEEFNKPAEPTLVPPRSAPPVSVAKPAPMAPRVPVKAAPQVARPQQQMPPQGAKPMQPSSPQSQEVLAERLRAQRAAAEKLAEQRVLAARDRAENTRPTAGAPTPPLKSAAPSSGSKPKFSFADEDSKSEPNRPAPANGRAPQRPPMAQPSLQPQLSPPRPSLGGERPLGGPARPQIPPAGYQPQFRPQPAQGYRPIDPTTGYAPPPPPPSRGYGNGVAPVDPRSHSPRLGGETYRRNGAAEDLGYPSSNYEPAQRGLSRREPLRAPAHSLDDDYSDDIFEEQAPPPRSARRASATDYNQAYRETDDGYGEQRRRSSGPWLLLLFLMLAAAAAGAGVWYYQTKIKTASTGTSSETTPVIAAPETSAKAAPEQPLENPQTAPGVTPSKKQIYDRIIGDKEILGGQVAPTEEVPVPPAASEANAQQIPTPGTESTTGSGEALPLPMPPPPGATEGTQGAIPAPAASETIAATTPSVKSATTESAAAKQLALSSAPSVNESAANSTQATPPSIVAPAEEEIVNEAPVEAPKKKVVAKAVEAKAKPKAKLKSEDTGNAAEPLVLVAPETNDTANDVTSGDIALQQPSTTPVPPVSAPAVKKKKTLFGLFNGTNDQVESAEAIPATQEQQVATIQNPPVVETPKKAAPVQSTAAAGGYYVQLASFKSEGEASAEYGRLKVKHSGILGGMAPVINPATVGGSTRYRLAIGPLASREQASNVCNSLVAAGERDCLVRKQ